MTIAEGVKYSERHIHRALQTLRLFGLLEVLRRGGAGRPNLYRIERPILEPLASRMAAVRSESRRLPVRERRARLAEAGAQARAELQRRADASEVVKNCAANLKMNDMASAPSAAATIAMRGMSAIFRLRRHTMTAIMSQPNPKRTYKKPKDWPPKSSLVRSAIKC